MKLSYEYRVESMPAEEVIETLPVEVDPVVEVEQLDLIEVKSEHTPGLEPVVNKTIFERLYDFWNKIWT